MVSERWNTDGSGAQSVGSLQDIQQMTAAIHQLNVTVGRLEQSVVTITSTLPSTTEPYSLSRSRHEHFFSFKQNALAGGFALPLSFAIMHPVDTIKTRMQAQTTKMEGNSGFMVHGRHALRSAGISMIQRGFLASVVGAAPQGALRLGTYGYVQCELSPYFDSPILRNAICAIIGDLSSSVIKVPREVIVQRLQTEMYPNVTSALRIILRDEGMKGFFRGYVSTTLRDIPFMVVLFTSYEQFKTWKVRFTTSQMRRDQPHDKEWSDMETVLWGGISGALAGYSTTPLDVVKTRIMTNVHIGASRSLRSNIMDIIKQEGVKGLFVGSVPRTGWWFCVCSIFFATYERVRFQIP